MSALIRLLPVPSDRMGNLWNLLALEDAYVLEYGPAGTTHFGVGPMASLNLEPRGRYFVTHMDESDVVMGSPARLERAVREVDRDRHPDHLFIVGSSVSSTIGTDLEGICFYLQDEVNGRLHIFDTGGLDENYLAGTKAVYRALAEIVDDLDCGKPEIEPATYNILGASPDHFRVESDLEEIRRLMATALVARCMTSFVIQGRIDRLPDAGKAQINLVIRDEALPLAKALERRFGTPFVRINMYGYEQTDAEIRRLAELMDLPVSPAYEWEIARCRKNLIFGPAFGSTANVMPHAAAIAPPFLLDGLKAVCAEWGVDLEALETTAPERERLEAVRRWEKSLVFCDGQMLKKLTPGSHGILASFPWVHKNIVATHLPMVGLRGMDFLTEEWMDYADSIL